MSEFAVCQDLAVLIDTNAPFFMRLHGLTLALADAPSPAITNRLRALSSDLDSIAAGTASTQAALERAPRLTDWFLVLQPDGIRMQGMLDQNALLRPKPVLTSAVWALDPTRRWARTLSRFYALGAPAIGQVRHRTH